MESMPSAGVGPFRPRGVGDLLSAAFSLYAKHWQALVGIAAIVIVPFTFVQYLLTDQVFKESAGVVVDETTGTITVSSSFGRSVLISLLVGLIGVLITQALTGAIARAAAGSLIGETPTAGSAYQYGFSRLWSILWIGLLVGLVVAGGLILFIIPGIYFGVKLAVSVPSLVVEDTRGSKAMGRSWNLTSGQFWHVLGTVVVAMIISGIVSAILTSWTGSSWVFAWIMSSIAQIITVPFTALVIMLVYIDLRVRKEAYTAQGLEMDLRSPGLGGPGASGMTPPPPPPPIA